MANEWRGVAYGKPVALDQLEAVAQELLDVSGGRKVWLFLGEMGSGKTTLIKVICEQLGVTSNMSSPTFSLVNEYATPGRKLYHFDFYRIRREEEAYDIGANEYLDSGNFCFVEWPDRIPSFWQTDYFLIRLAEVTQTTRSIEYSFYVREKKIGI